VLSITAPAAGRNPDGSRDCAEQKDRRRSCQKNAGRRRTRINSFIKSSKAKSTYWVDLRAGKKTASDFF